MVKQKGQTGKADGKELITGWYERTEDDEIAIKRQLLVQNYYRFKLGSGGRYLVFHLGEARNYNSIEILNGFLSVSGTYNFIHSSQPRDSFMHRLVSTLRFSMFVGFFGLAKCN